MGTRFKLSFFATSLAVFLVGASAVLGQEYFLGEVVFVPGATFSVNKGEPNARHLTILGLKLDKQTLKEAQEKLGQAQIIHPGHHEYPLLCYRSARGDDETVLTLSFDDEDPRKKLMGFQIIAGSEKFKARRKCTRSALVSRDLATESGIQLGLTPEQFKALWDVQVTEQRDHLVIRFDAYRESLVAGEAHCNDVFSSAVARFVKSKLTWLDLGMGGEFIRVGHCTEGELAGRRN